METNPRTMNAIEWAPPPPLAGPDQEKQVEPRHHQRQIEVTEREEFETTLSTLVDQFTSLPPPAYGEPPELVSAPAKRCGMTPQARNRRRGVRIIGWTATACLVLAGGAGVGMYFGLQGAPAQAAGSRALVPAVPPVITVKAAPLDEAPPRAQPLTDEALVSAAESPSAGQPLAVPLAEEIEQLQAAPPVAASKPQLSAADRPKPRLKRARRAAVTKRQPQATPAAADWENPYE